MGDVPQIDSSEDWAALIQLVDADHRDHGIPDRSVPHDCADFHYPCPTSDVGALDRGRPDWTLGSDPQR